jgi:membrane protease subunit (stomatin/prohibitin family)
VQQYKDEPVYPQQQFTGEGSAQSFNREYQAPHMVPEGTPICPGCGTGLEANALFCGECGYSLPQRIPACVGCGNPLEPEAKFCGECGTPVQQANPAAEGEKKQGWVGKFMKFLEE